MLGKAVTETIKEKRVIRNVKGMGGEKRVLGGELQTSINPEGAGVVDCCGFDESGRITAVSGPS